MYSNATQSNYLGAVHDPPSQRKTYQIFIPQPHASNLELVDLVSSVPQLCQDTLTSGAPSEALLAQQCLLHRRWATHHDLGVAARRHRHLLEQLLGHITLPEPTVRTAHTRADCVHGAEAVLAESVLEPFQLLAQKDVLLRVDAKHEADLGLVGGVVQDALDQLVARGDAGAARDEGDGVVLVGDPLVPGDDDGEHDLVAGGQRVQVGGLSASGVLFDEEVDHAGRVGWGDGGVWPGARGPATVGEADSEKGSYGSSSVLLDDARRRRKKKCCRVAGERTHKLMATR